MKQYQLKVGGEDVIINAVQTPEDYEVFRGWLAEQSRPLACDTETTGLDIFQPHFKVRLIQLGTETEAWCIPAEMFDTQLLKHRKLIFQHAAYDVLCFRQCLGCSLDWSNIVDTKILAHLVDPRSTKEGGTGLKLEELTRHYIDARIADEIKSSMKTLAKNAKCKVSEVFANIDIDDDAYLTYAGMDVILTARLFNELLPRVPQSSAKLIRYEHEIARVCCELMFNGFLLDVDYAKKYSEQLKADQDYWEAIAYVEYGVESVNANAEVAEALIESGVKLKELTDSGAYRVSKDVLEPLAKQGHRLAEAVLEAKKVKKQRKTWVEKFLDERDTYNRCHAFIHPLQARTGRMSITGIPAQTLPADDWRVRRCFIPDEGHQIVSCDYQAQELRVLAALSGDENMIDAFKHGKDLHQITADASGVSRSVGKTVNFAYVYGSGPTNIAETCGITVPRAKQVIQGFENAYPRVKELSERLQAEATKNGYITTPTGRRLPVDSDRAYAALNYMIQSTSRDITAAALLRLDAAGFTPYLRLPVHDEIVASIPEAHVESGMKRIADIMATDFAGVHIGTDAEAYGASWGGGYVSDDEAEDYAATL